MKLIFINGIPTSKIFGDKVDAWWFSKNGFDVEFWDISPLYYSKKELADYYGGNTEYRYVGPNHIIFDDKSLLFESLNSLDKAVKIFYLSRTIYKMIDDTDVLIHIQELGLKYYLQVFSILREPVGLKEKVIHNARMIKHSLANKKLLPTACFGSGKITRKYVAKIFPYAKYISINSINIEWNILEKVLEKKYVLFIDESMEYEPDAKMLNTVSCTDITAYYRRMNKLFGDIEQWLGLPVIIGASGKYRYPANKFGNREIIYKKTFALMEYADLLITHTTSAIYHNIKSKKPLLLVDDDSFTNRKRKGFIHLKNFTNNIIKSDNVTINDINHILNAKLSNMEQIEIDEFREKNSVNYKEASKDIFMELNDE